MISNLQSLLNIVFNYSFFFVEGKFKCPYCQLNSRRTKTYKTLKQLSWHISNQHAEANTNSPFTVEQVREVLKVLAVAKQWRILVE